MSETRESIGTILQKLADELCPDMQAGYLSESVNKIMIILDGKVKAARVGGMEAAIQPAQAGAQSHFYDHTPLPPKEMDCLLKDIADTINVLIEVENAN